jgi:hypothetical protein
MKLKIQIEDHRLCSTEENGKRIEKKQQFDKSKNICIWSD